MSTPDPGSENTDFPESPDLSAGDLDQVSGGAGRPQSGPSEDSVGGGTRRTNWGGYDVD